VLAFLRGQTVRERCRRVPTGMPPAVVPPVRFSDLRPVGRVPVRIGRTLRALGATLQDVAVAASIAVRGGGLRGGSFSIVGGGVILDRMVVVPGVRVSGRIRSSGAIDLRVGGSAAAPGRVRVRPGGPLMGRLGGRDLQPLTRPGSGSGSAGARAAAVSAVAATAGLRAAASATVRAGRHSAFRHAFVRLP
jgi:hypothetical protein